MFKKQNKKGLTLIELLAVIAIIAILFVLLIPQINNAIVKSRDTGIMNDFRDYQNALYSFEIENPGNSTNANINKYLPENLKFKIFFKSDKLNPYGNPYFITYNKINQVAIYTLDSSNNT